jgi:hypothetical protein
LTTLPTGLRLRLLLLRERDLEERIFSGFQPYSDGLVTGCSAVLRQKIQGHLDVGLTLRGISTVAILLRS